MAVLPLRIYPDPVLRTPAAPVTTFDDELRRLVNDMVDTMRHHHGAGLAAPQVGVLRRVFVYECGGKFGHLINPQWERVGDEKQTDLEGCLSIPDIRAETTRWQRVIAHGLDVTGAEIEVEGEAIVARAIQHESDHLDGVLFLARLEPQQRRTAMREIRGSSWFNHDSIDA